MALKPKPVIGTPIKKPKRTFVRPATAKRAKPPPAVPGGPTAWSDLSEAKQANLTQILARDRWKFFEVSKFEGPCCRCANPILAGNQPVFWHPAVNGTTGKSQRMHAFPCGERYAEAMARGSVSTPLSPGNPTTLAKMPRPPMTTKEITNDAPRKPDPASGPKPKFARIPAHIKFR